MNNTDFLIEKIQKGYYLVHEWKPYEWFSYIEKGSNKIDITHNEYYELMRNFCICSNHIKASEDKHIYFWNVPEHFKTRPPPIELTDELLRKAAFTLLHDIRKKKTSPQELVNWSKSNPKILKKIHDIVLQMLEYDSYENRELRFMSSLLP